MTELTLNILLSYTTRQPGKIQKQLLLDNMQCRTLLCRREQTDEIRHTLITLSAWKYHQYYGTGSGIAELREREKTEFGEVRQLELVGQRGRSKSEEEGNTEYRHRGPLVSSTYKAAWVKHEIPQDQAKNNCQGVVQRKIISVFMRLESFRFQLARAKTFLNETSERLCQTKAKPNLEYRLLCTSPIRAKDKTY